MKTLSLAKFLVLPLMAFVLMGCPYSSTVPLSEANTKIPDSFIGTWEKTGTEGEKTEVKRTGPNTVDIIQPGMSDEYNTVYKGHFTEIGGQLFLNVKEDNEYSGYYLFKVEKEGDYKINLSEVTPYIRETFDNSAALKSFVEKNMHNSYFFTNEDAAYFKVK